MIIIVIIILLIKIKVIIITIIKVQYKPYPSDNLFHFRFIQFSEMHVGKRTQNTALSNVVIGYCSDLEKKYKIQNFAGLVCVTVNRCEWSEWNSCCSVFID